MDFLASAWGSLQGAASGVVVALGVGTGLIYLAHQAPKIAKRELDELFLYMRSSKFLNVPGPCHAKRKAFMVATLEWLECELPEPGRGRAVYEKWGACVANRLGRWLFVFKKTGKKWANVFEQIGDSIDPVMDKEIVRLGGHPEK